jgi:hypothetical protein
MGDFTYTLTLLGLLGGGLAIGRAALWARGRITGSVSRSRGR